MTLKYSGKSFRKVVWKADQETWVRLHEEAFRTFGGSVTYVVLYRELSQVSKDLSSFQTARPRGTSEVLEPSSQLRIASVFARSMSSAYRLVVSRLTCPSHPRMTLTSTPDSST
jgi:hypothetical protein